MRVQAVLPGATATEFWDVAGFPHANMPKSIVMAAEDMVDAALAGLDAGELVTIPGLHDGDGWTSFEASRRALSKQFGNSTPAPRYTAPRDRRRVKLLSHGKTRTMETLSFAPRHDHDPVTLVEDDANEPTGAPRPAPLTPPAYRAVGVLDSLSAHAAVLGCSGACGAPAI